jgi:hypothetical protein
MSDGDDDDEDDSGEEGDEMNWEEGDAGLEEVIAWAKDENELRMKREEMKTGMEWTRERGAMRKSIVLSETGRGLRSALRSGFPRISIHRSSSKH